MMQYDIEVFDTREGTEAIVMNVFAMEPMEACYRVANKRGLVVVGEIENQLFVMDQDCVAKRLQSKDPTANLDDFKDAVLRGDVTEAYGLYTLFLTNINIQDWNLLV
jgi:hypothetical protein